jgi:hypothetical protein
MHFFSSLLEDSKNYLASFTKTLLSLLACLFAPLSLAPPNYKPSINPSSQASKQASKLKFDH